MREIVVYLSHCCFLNRLEFEIKFPFILRFYKFLLRWL